MNRSIVSSSQVIRKASSFLNLIAKESNQIYIRPNSSSFILVDDLSLEMARKMWSEGYQCCVLLQTSPQNYQAWVKVSPSPIPNELSTAVGKILAEKFNGDKASVDYRHLGRLAGFPNMKPKYLTEEGTYPIVSLDYAGERIADNAPLLLEEAEKSLQKVVVYNDDIEALFEKASIKVNIPRTSQSAVEFAELLYQCKLYELDNPDFSTVDFWVCLRLIQRGFCYEDVFNALDRFSPNLEERKKGHINDYLNRTINACLVNILKG